MIHKLTPDVINRIAAGEVVQRPYNAIKQLIQNSIDAGSTKINLKIQFGGLKKIQIRDNGRGIILQDFPLLCERYATSKIKSVTDLQSIQSFGFRGEALASLTHVGQVQVISRHQSSDTGYYAKFDKQKLLTQPKRAKRQIGTTIIVQNLFSMLTSRRKSLIPNQQRKMVKQLVYEMALDYPHVQFSLTTQKGIEMQIDYRIKQIKQARLSIFCQMTGMKQNNCIVDKVQIKSTQVFGIFSKLHTWDSWRRFIVTINHRIVQSPQIEKVIQKAYDQANRTVHKQNYSFCVYVNIKIDPRKIDCNVHPTKKQIHFYKSTDLFASIREWIEKLLQESGTMKYLDSHSRMNQHTLMDLQEKLRQKLPFGLNSQPLNVKIQVGQNQKMYPNSQDGSQSSSKKRQSMTKNRQFMTAQQRMEYDCNRTRTDSKQLPLQYFYKNLISQNSYSSSSKIKSQLQEQGSQTKKFFIYQNFVDRFKQSNKTKQNSIVKNFIVSITYVGCFNSSLIFIQVQNKLYCWGISHFIKSYIREILKQKRPLYIKRLKGQNAIDISKLMDQFLAQYQNVLGYEKISRIYNTVMEEINFNRDYLLQKYGIQINQFMELQSYPIIEKNFQNEELRQQSLAYFLMHLFAKRQLQNQEDILNLYMEFLGNPFYDLYDDQQKRYQKSDFSDRYDNFFGNQMIPMLKLKGKFYQEQYQGLRIQNLLSEMMDLRDAYKMFQRC